MNSWILIIFNGLSFLLHLIILMLKLSKIWPAEAPSCSFLCFCNILPWFFFFFRTSFLCDIIRFRPFYLSDSCPAISHFFMHLRFLLVENGIRDKDRGRQGHSHWDVFPFAMFSKQLRNTCRCKHTHALTYPHYYNYAHACIYTKYAYFTNYEYFTQIPPLLVYSHGGSFFSFSIPYLCVCSSVRSQQH